MTLLRSIAVSVLKETSIIQCRSRTRTGPRSQRRRVNERIWPWSRKCSQSRDPSAYLVRKDCCQDGRREPTSGIEPYLEVVLAKVLQRKFFLYRVYIRAS